MLRKYSSVAVSHLLLSYAAISSSPLAPNQIVVDASPIEADGSSSGINHHPRGRRAALKNEQNDRHKRNLKHHEKKQQHDKKKKDKSAATAEVVPTVSNETIEDVVDAPIEPTTPATTVKEMAEPSTPTIAAPVKHHEKRQKHNKVKKDHTATVPSTTTPATTTTAVAIEEVKVETTTIAAAIHEEEDTSAHKETMHEKKKKEKAAVTNLMHKHKTPPLATESATTQTVNEEEVVASPDNSDNNNNKKKKLPGNSSILDAVSKHNHKMQVKAMRKQDNKDHHDDGMMDTGHTGHTGGKSGKSSRYTPSPTPYQPMTKSPTSSSPTPYHTMTKAPSTHAPTSYSGKAHKGTKSSKAAHTTHKPTTTMPTDMVTPFPSPVVTPFPTPEGTRPMVDPSYSPTFLPTVSPTYDGTIEPTYIPQDATFYDSFEKATFPSEPYWMVTSSMYDIGNDDGYYYYYDDDDRYTQGGRRRLDHEEEEVEEEKAYWELTQKKAYTGMYSIKTPNLNMFPGSNMEPRTSNVTLDMHGMWDSNQHDSGYLVFSLLCDTMSDMVSWYIDEEWWGEGYKSGQWQTYSIWIPPGSKQVTWSYWYSPYYFYEAGEAYLDNVYFIPYSDEFPSYSPTLSPTWSPTLSPTFYPTLAPTMEPTIGETVMECRDSEDCLSEDNYCHKQSCDNRIGMCRPKHVGGCPRVYRPVCSCDGMTYGNDCEARVAGANIDYEGVCVVPSSAPTLMDDEVGKQCDTGSYAWSTPCTSPENYCAMEMGVCKIDIVGTCQVKPQKCTRIRRPVCGCNNRTYSNECVARRDGVSILHEGECEEGNQCSPMMDPCKNTDIFYCKMRKGVCGLPESRQGGTCTSTEGVFCTSQWKPVCGCDQRVYGNACEAGLAGVSVLRDLDTEGYLPGERCGTSD